MRDGCDETPKVGLTGTKLRYWQQKLCILGKHVNDRWPKQICTACTSKYKKRRSAEPAPKALNPVNLVREVYVDREGDGCFRISLVYWDARRESLVFSKGALWALAQGLNDCLAAPLVHERKLKVL